MSLTSIRPGNLARQVLLVLILLIVGAAFGYDSLVIKPQFTEAWSKVKEIDSSNLSGATTAEDVHQAIDREPTRVDDTTRKNIVVETYSWQRGTLVSSYDIHVIYTKNPNTDKLFYYSAVAGRKPVDKNFPNTEPVVVNLNPPPIGRGGGPAPTPQPTPRTPDADDKKSDDEKGGDTSGKDQEQSGDEGKDSESKKDDTKDDGSSGKKSDGDQDKDQSD